MAFHKIVIAQLTPQFFPLDVDGPTLVRVNQLFTSAGVPIVAPTTGGFVELAAWPSEETPPGASGPERTSRAWRGTGPLIYLPFKGRWHFVYELSTLGGVCLPVATMAELSLISMPPEVAASYLTAPPASFHVSGNFTVAAGAGFNVFSASGISLAASPPATCPATWFNLCRFELHMNTTPMTDFKVAIGRTAAAGVGAVVAGLGRRIFEWQAIAGQTVFVFNNTAGAADVSIEAHFI